MGQRTCREREKRSRKGILNKYYLSGEGVSLAFLLPIPRELSGSIPVRLQTTQILALQSGSRTRWPF